MMLNKIRILGLFVVIATLAMGGFVSRSPASSGYEGPPPRESSVTFTNVSEEVGLSGMTGNFFSWGDHDNDGDQDLLVNGRRLMVNTGPPSYRFVDQTDIAGISSSANSGVFADYDNDGYLDIFCGGGRGSSDHPEHPDILWHNERDGTFSKVGPGEGIPGDTFPTVAAGWSDVNRDGNVDLYMVNYEDSSFEGYPDHFHYNNGDGTFTNGTVSSGMSEKDHPYQGRGVSFCDFDNDGFQDAYVSNYRIMPNYLYRNMGNGTMRESASQYNVEGHGNLHPVTREGPYYGHSLGSSWGDMDNDGDMDLWVTNLAHKDVYRGPICDDSYLFENLGEEQDYMFRDVREGSGIEIKPLGGTVTEGDELMVSSSLADYDNDGDLDLFVPQIYNDIEYAHSFLYGNNGDMTFREVGGQAGMRVWNTYGSAWCDYNNDGWMDLVTGGGTWSDEDGNVQNKMIHLFRNNGALQTPERKWIEIDLKGRESNSAAIGARVHVMVDTDGDGVFDLDMMRDVEGGTAAHGQQNSMRLHFGLGDEVADVHAEVDWPLGRNTFLDDLEINSVTRIIEPADPLSLELDIVNVTDDEGNAGVHFRIQNPNEEAMDDVSVKVELRYEEDRVFKAIDVGPILAKKTIVYDFSDSGIPYEGLREVEASVVETFPPLADDPGDIFTIDDQPLSDPVAVLNFPETASIGEEITASGSSSYSGNGPIDEYYFDFGDGTGTGWTDRSTVAHEYSIIGNFTLRLRVMDIMGKLSNWTSGSIMITEKDYDPPRAEILSVEPSDPVEGETVVFSGAGTADEELSVNAYEWTSSRDGLLSRRSSFREDDLSVGDHEISFKVKDSRDVWSKPDIILIAVVKEGSTRPWVDISPLPMEGPLEGTVIIRGTAGPPGEVSLVEVKVDSDPWKEARGTDEWEFPLNANELSGGERHVLQARAMSAGSYSEIESMDIRIAADDDESPDTGSVHQTGSYEGGISKDLLVVSVISVLVVLVVGIVMLVVVARSRGGPGYSGRRINAIELD